MERKRERERQREGKRERERERWRESLFLYESEFKESNDFGILVVCACMRIERYRIALFVHYRVASSQCFRHDINESSDQSEYARHSESSVDYGHVGPYSRPMYRSLRSEGDGLPMSAVPLYILTSEREPCM